MKGTKDIRVILHNVRSAHNVGSAFRTCDAAGIAHLYLCGYTPTPLDRFSRLRKDIAKVALGAEKTLAWSHEASIADLISRLKKDGYAIIAVEQSSHSVDYKKSQLGEKAAIIFGNEVGGISSEILDCVDCIAEIPMRGQKESLNVSVSLGVALFRMLDR